MKSESNLSWLLVAVLAVGFTLWYQDRSGSYEANIQQLQDNLKTCKSEFSMFKDGVTYGK
ncbi:hypothetical protein [Halotia branconii]|uniref:Uncharacterized protein n=1 Tax=Halotia branconii CENA392 TaxID=1539056 RepID=A0AAJ6NSZ1_9CYAN|nr:hypothetical protein [Halotia branconii]WGV23457.1 hypothetical protein QI031_16665 [Halotia branconii CENA392]WGV25940.1 hypothetical protein QI031_30260 [Halotia branconii CENA392]WGV25956.1 hypothetical protein QI031_00070 [Halotia branconii CENA392]